jgi:hypothetical protein
MIHDSPRGNNSALSSQKCIGCSDERPNSPPPTNFYSIKPYLKPIWTYGIQLWGTASTFNIEILE